MERINYSDLLKDPQWQKKRLEIFQRDKWTCQLCKDNKETLHVHHFKYTKGKNPWEYLDKDLITLCEDCHFIVGVFHGWKNRIFTIRIIKTVIQTTTDKVFLVITPSGRLVMLSIGEDRKSFCVHISIDKEKIKEFFING